MGKKQITAGRSLDFPAVKRLASNSVGLLPAAARTAKFQTDTGAKDALGHVIARLQKVQSPALGKEERTEPVAADGSMKHDSTGKHFASVFRSVGGGCVAVNFG